MRRRLRVHSDRAARDGAGNLGRGSLRVRVHSGELRTADVAAVPVGTGAGRAAAARHAEDGHGGGRNG
ncbi:MAG TPA: hypothetical protein VK028_14335 [Micromonosporaceae bacterium]|nr:hypothetical protein [Micromonosporaceae bacterium]